MMGVLTARALFLLHPPGSPDKLASEGKLDLKPGETRSKLWNRWYNTFLVNLIQVEQSTVDERGLMPQKCIDTMFCKSQSIHYDLLSTMYATDTIVSCLELLYFVWKVTYKGYI